MNCVNRHSVEFKELVKELNIHPDIVEVYVHTYQNSQYAINYLEKHGDLPFPTKAYIEEQFLTNTSTGPKAIKDWARATYKYGFGSKEFDTVQQAKNAQRDIAKQLKIPVSKVPLVCTALNKYKVMYNRPSINNTKELSTLLQSVGMARVEKGKLLLNYIGSSVDNYFDAIDKANALLDTLNVSRDAITIQGGEISLQQDFSDAPAVLSSENPAVQRSILEERKKLGALNHPFATRGSKKKDAEYLTQGNISQHVRAVILKALETNPALRAFTPLLVFNMITKQYEGDIAEDYEKHVKKPIIAALEKHLTDYLKKYNVEIKEDAAQFGEDVFGVYDILNKTIHLAKNRNALTLTEEFAHAFVELLGSKVSNKEENKDYTFLYNNVEGTSIYKKVFEEYKDTYKDKYGNPDIAKIKKETIGQALAVSINNQWESVEEKEKRWFQAIKEWFLKLLDSFSEMEYVNFDTLINKMAKEVIQKDYSRLNKVDSSQYKLLDYAQTFADQAKIDGGKALDFMQTFCNEFGAIITGSLAYRAQGTVYRSSADALHDIDMVIKESAHGISVNDPIVKAAIRNNTFGSDHLLKVIKERSYFKAVQAKYPNLELLAAYPGTEGITVNSIYSENPELRERFKNLKGSYAKRLEPFTAEEKRQMYLFDFFLAAGEEEYVMDPKRGIALQKAGDIFKAKLRMGRAKDIFDYQMYARYEDYHNSKVSSEDYLMYQKGKITYEDFNQQQKDATDKAVDFLLSDKSDKEYFLIEGKAGTGKTTIINEIVSKFEEAKQEKGEGIGVFVAAVSNKATLVLAGKIDKITETQRREKVTGKKEETTSTGSLAALFGQSPVYTEDGEEIWDMQAVLNELDWLISLGEEHIPIAKLGKNTILFVDECSMIDDNKMFLLQAFQLVRHFKMVMMGDSGQVEPVVTERTPNLEAKFKKFKDGRFASLVHHRDRTLDISTSFSFTNTANKALLTERMRQGEESPILLQADQFWQIGTYEMPINPLDMSGTTVVDPSLGSGIIYQDTSKDHRSPFEEAVQIVQLGIAENNPDKIRIVAYTNKAVQQANLNMYRQLHPNATEAQKTLQAILDKDIITWYNTQMYVPNPGDPHNKIKFVNSESAVVTKGTDPMPWGDDAHFVEALEQLLKCFSEGGKRSFPQISRDIKFQFVTVLKENKYYQIPIVCPASRLLYSAWKKQVYGWLTKCLDNDWCHTGSIHVVRTNLNILMSVGEVGLGYAITTHKSQGSTFDVTMVNYDDFKKASLKPSGLTELQRTNVDANLARLLYTAYTRSSNITFVYHNGKDNDLDNGYAALTHTLKEINDAANKTKGKKVTAVASKPLTAVVLQAEGTKDSWTNMQSDIDKMFAEHTNTISFDEDSHTYYYHPEGKTSLVKETCTTSVTSWTTPFAGERNPVIETAGEIAKRLGNTVDTFLRDFFMKDRGETFCKGHNYPNLNAKDKKVLLKAAHDLKKYLDGIYGNTRYTIRTDNFSVVGRVKNADGTYSLTGGTVDMIIFDEKGNYRILDFKTSREDIDGNAHNKKTSYSDLINAYRTFFEKMHPKYLGKFSGGLIFQLQTTYTPSEGQWTFVDQQVMHDGINVLDTSNWVGPQLFGNTLGRSISSSIIEVKEKAPEKHWYQGATFCSEAMEIIGPKETPKATPKTNSQLDANALNLQEDAYKSLGFTAYRPFTSGLATFHSLAHAAIARAAYMLLSPLLNEILQASYDPNIYLKYIQLMLSADDILSLEILKEVLGHIATDIRASFSQLHNDMLLNTLDKGFKDNPQLPSEIRDAYLKALVEYRKELRKPKSAPQPGTRPTVQPGTLPSAGTTISINYGDKSTPYWLLSNMAERKFIIGDVRIGDVQLSAEDLKRTFSCVEQAFQYIKVKYFGTNTTKDAVADNILNSNNPYDMRDFGQDQTIGLETSRWDAESKRIHGNLMYLSFNLNKEARDLLLSTGNAEFEHSAPGRYSTVFPEALKKIREVFLSRANKPTVPVDLVYTEYFNAPTSTLITVKDTLKPWKSDPNKTNPSRRFYIKGLETKGYFELVKDLEDNYYSVHFKPTGDKNTFSHEEKLELTKAIMEVLPEGSFLSTWGEISKGGLNGIKRIGSHTNFVKVDSRTLVSKEDKTLHVEVPILKKDSTGAIRMEQRKKSDAYNTAGRNRLIKEGVTYEVIGPLLDNNSNIVAVFTDNAQAYVTANNARGAQPLEDSWIASGFNKGDKVQLNVTAKSGNTAGIRTNVLGDVRGNAIGITVKKYQLKEDLRSFLAKEGQFQDTEEDFALFKKLNRHALARIKKGIEGGHIKTIIFPRLMALGRAALPYRFAEWLMMELNDAFDAGLAVENTIKKSPNPLYDGYGLDLTSANFANSKEGGRPVKDVNHPAALYTLHSGGAIGSDYFWGKEGENWGLGKANHYYRQSNDSESRPPYANAVISAEDSAEGEGAYPKACKLLGKSETKDPAKRDLMIRNWSLAKHADAIYGIIEGFIDGKECKLPGGGTGYALMYGVLLNKPVFVYCLETKKWYKAHYNSEGIFTRFREYNSATTGLNMTPIIVAENFAGIGTRSINNDGMLAIRDVYQKTFNTVERQKAIIEEEAKYEDDKDYVNKVIKDAVSVEAQAARKAAARRFFTLKEIERIQQGLSKVEGNGRTLVPIKVFSASRRTDAIFYVDKIINALKKNAELPIGDPKRVYAIEIWSKHDGIPMIKLLEACKKYRVAPMVSFSITSLGGDADWEPGVMKYQDLIARIKDLVSKGYLDPATTTVRLDPIVPGKTRIEDFLAIVTELKALGITKYVTSIMQSYGYLVGTDRDRGIIKTLAEKGYDWDAYYAKDKNGKHKHTPKLEVIKEWRDKLHKLKEDNGIILESCAFNQLRLDISACLDPETIKAVTGIENIDEGNITEERPTCKCYGHKSDLLAYSDACLSSCAYCYAAQMDTNPLRFYDDNGLLIDDEYGITRTELTEAEAEELRKEEEISEVQKLAQLSMNPTMSDTPSKLISPEEVELIHLRENLMTSNLFTGTQMMDLAKAAAFKFSEIVTRLSTDPNAKTEYFPEGSKYLDIDYTSMSRIEIINELTPAVIFSIVRDTTFTGRNNPNWSNIKGKNKRKLLYISANWKAFLEMVTKPLMNAESIAINSAAGEIIDLSTADDTLLQDALETAEILGSSLETWQIGFRQVSAHNSLSQLLKSFLGNLDKIDIEEYKNSGKEVPVMSEFGTTEKVNASEVVNKILLWCQGARTLSEMVDKLYEHTPKDAASGTDSWVVQVINALEKLGNSTFQSLFFSNFKKYFQPYMIQYRKGGPNGQLMHKVINNKSIGLALLEELLAKWQHREEGTLMLYTDEGRLNTAAVKRMKAQTERRSERASNELLIVHMPPIDALVQALNSKTQNMAIDESAYVEGAHSLLEFALCLEASLTDEQALQLVKNEKSLRTLWNSMMYIAKDLEKHVNDGSYSLFTDSKLTTNLLEFLELVTQDAVLLESCSYEKGKMHYSYVAPSYLTNLVDKLKGNVANYNEMLHNEYGLYGWFKLGNHYRLHMLDKLAKDATYRENFGHYVLLSTDKIGYTEKSPRDYIMSILLLYFSGTSYGQNGEPTHSKWGFFRVPIMSNKPSEEYIRMEKFTGMHYKEDILDLLIEMVELEADRINTCRERVKQGKKEIKNFDKNGQKFIMMSFMLHYLEAYHKTNAADFTDIRTLITENPDKVTELLKNEDAHMEAAIGSILESMIDNSPIEDASTRALLEAAITYEMGAKYQDFLKYLRKKGVIRTKGNNLDLSDLTACNLGQGEDMVMDNLENFFWNDFLGANVILLLTVTDTAFYKDTEDLQKRLAQIHAPGLRCNTEAVWVDPKDSGKTVAVSDGHTRTIYLKDFDNVVSSAIENVRLIFKNKYEKLLQVTPEEAKIFKETSNAIIELFKGINVADAQGYSSITSYRKKAIMFGKWSEQLELTYQKIRSGKYTSRDLNMSLQPLKPFVYSNTKKSSPGTLGNLKVGVQNKNSEYLLIIMDAIIKGEGGTNSSKLAAIYDFMEESHYDEKGNYKTNGIDTVQFESTVKAGLQGAIDINYAKSRAEVKLILESAAYTNGRGSEYNEEVVHELNFEDYCLQSEVPAHLEGKSIYGSLTRILSISDLPLLTNGADNIINFRGKNITVKELKDQYNQANVNNIYHSFKTLVKELNLEGTLADRNIAISRLLLDTIKKDGRYGYELLYAVSTDEYGKFNMPLSDPTIATQVLSLLNSLIKNRINKQEIPGGPVVQVTNFGTSSQLEIHFKDKDGNSLPSLKEFYERSLSQGLVAKFNEKFKVVQKRNTLWEKPKYSFQEFINMAHYEHSSKENELKLYKEVYLPIINEYNRKVVTKQHSIEYMECYAPSTVFEEYADKTGFIDISAVPKEKLDLIGYRIPTESKYSMAPLRIKGFLPHEAGEGIMLPYEITLLSGSDFDGINVKVKLC